MNSKKQTGIRSVKQKKMNKTKKRLALYIGLPVFVILIGVIWFAFDYRSVKGGIDAKHISEGIYIGDVDVSGMSQKEAKETVEKHVEKLGNKTLTLYEKENKQSVDVPITKLGLHCTDLDKAAEKAVQYGKKGNIFSKYKALKSLKKEKKVFEMKLAADKKSVSKVVKENQEKFEVPATDATIKKTADGFEITDELKGVKVDIDASMKSINKFMSDDWDHRSGKVSLTVKTDKPKVTAKALKSVNDLLGTATTKYGSSGAGRSKNVESGAQHINGSVLMPGDTFSVYKKVTPFTEENGYAMAGSYENGQVVDSMGGGICQVSTTLYNTVLNSELEVVERFPHSMIVTYVDPSKDAAIAGTWKDLKFKNNYKTPVFIEAYTIDKTITFNIYGKETRPKNRTVEYKSEIVETIQPKVKFVATSAPIGSKSTKQSAHVGKSAKLWKIVYEDGKEVSREQVNKSKYAASPRTVEVGTASSDAQAVAEINAAIAAQNEDAINAAIAGAKQRAADTAAAAAAAAAQPPAADPAADQPAADPAAEAPQSADPAVPPVQQPPEQTVPPAPAA